MNPRCLAVVLFIVITSLNSVVECKPSPRMEKRSAELPNNEFPNSSTQPKHSEPIREPMGVEIKRVVQGIDFSFIAEQVALALGMWSPVDYISQREANSSAPAAALNPPQSQFGSRVVFQRGQRANVAVKPRSFVELKSFHTDAYENDNDQATIRGSRFYAPISGLYQLSTNLHFSISKEHSSKRKDAARNKHIVRLLICVNSLCQKNESLEYFAPTNRRSRVFSVSFSGFLPIKVGQYVSVFIENSSLNSVSLLGGSSFSGMCIQ
ncbi:hypothetical protein CAPTEDRAFT_207085 [Capitella teleta]|uniref:C1q domain-containing protein n=1 Tax=Capitella teleta TaxID=283909 RepID=R7VFM5_CAPTE|nr:hypothetical protein CAPTEDRAFT_207085 [Capitella teleta]|eukprot:ELU17419.1 hypothetical protein CAPTEDRAFT_207085 [Capitella teleta]